MTTQCQGVERLLPRTFGARGGLTRKCRGLACEGTAWQREASGAASAEFRLTAARAAQSSNGLAPQHVPACCAAVWRRCHCRIPAELLTTAISLMRVVGSSLARHLPQPARLKQWASFQSVLFVRTMGSRRSLDALDWVIVVYLASHVATVFAIDSQLVLADILGPDNVWEQLGLAGAMRQWSSLVGDSLVASPPAWFKAIIWCELLLQLPFCAVGAWAWASQKEWIRLPAALYAGHVLTTMAPIVTVLAMDGTTPLGLAVYGLWILFPALVLMRIVGAGQSLFGEATSPKRD